MRFRAKPRRTLGGMVAVSVRPQLSQITCIDDMVTMRAEKHTDVALK